MNNNDVTIAKEGKYWLVRIPAINGLTQARNYAEVELMAREYISLVRDVGIDQVKIASITVEGVSDAIRQAAEERALAKELESAASRRVREAAKSLRTNGVSLVDIGAILGVSHQRVHQLVEA